MRRDQDLNFQSISKRPDPLVRKPVRRGARERLMRWSSKEINKHCTGCIWKRLIEQASLFVRSRTEGEEKREREEPDHVERKKEGDFHALFRLQMGRRRGGRRPQRPHGGGLPGPLRPLRRRPRASPRHRRCRRHGGARSWLPILPLQLRPEPPPPLHHQVRLYPSIAHSIPAVHRSIPIIFNLIGVSGWVRWVMDPGPWLGLD